MGDQPVVVKVFYEGVTPSHEQREAFRREVAFYWFLRKYNNFTSVLGYSCDPCMILLKEFPVGNLEDFLISQSFKKGNPEYTITNKTRVSFAKDIMTIVKTLQSYNLVHCSLSSKTLMVCFNIIFRWIDSKIVLLLF
jgi:hypothetical protein